MLIRPCFRISPRNTLLLALNRGCPAEAPASSAPQRAPQSHALRMELPE